MRPPSDLPDAGKDRLGKTSVLTWVQSPGWTEVGRFPRDFMFPSADLILWCFLTQTRQHQGGGIEGLPISPALSSEYPFLLSSTSLHHNPGRIKPLLLPPSILSSLHPALPLAHTHTLSDLLFPVIFSLPLFDLLFYYSRFCSLFYLIQSFSSGFLSPAVSLPMSTGSKKEDDLAGCEGSGDLWRKMNFGWHQVGV